MAEIFAVIGGDGRQRYLAEGLSALGNVVRTFAVPGTEDTVNNLKDTLHLASCVILPMPLLDSEGYIRNGRGLPLTPSQITDFLPPGARVFAGKPGCAAGVLSKAALLEDYSTWEALAIHNAAVTAEGALILAGRHMDATIQGSRFLVVGAGRIGMFLAQKLQALGGNVTVSARKERDLARIEALGLTADITKQYTLGLGGYDCIFNTVPNRVFTSEQMKTIADNCIIIELASAPGGFPPDAGARILSGAALPGKMYPRTAGHLLLQEILKHIRPE